MRPFEDELRKALARREPGEDFVQQVLSKVEARRPVARRTRSFAWGTNWWRFASAAVLLITLFSGIAYRQHEQAIRGEEAKRKLLIAMRIAGSQLHQAQLRVKQIQSDEVVQ